MRFIRKALQGEKLFVLTLTEDREESSEDGYHAMNFSLITQGNKSVADGRCSLIREEGCNDYIYISAIYVEGNNNYPTIKEPNRFTGLGQILVFTAIKFGIDLGVKTVRLAPLTGSEGFYIKMGFRPEVKGNANRMAVLGDIQRSKHGKLNPVWLTNFKSSSFTHPEFRGPSWVATIPSVYPILRNNILSSWSIIE